MSASAVIGGVSAIASLIGGSKNKPNYTIPTDPTAQMDPSQMDPILRNLLASADRSAEVRWGSTNEQLMDAYQRRGLGGSGIEFRNISEQARQQQLDTDAQKQSYAMDIYKLWLMRKQQERDWAMGIAQMQNQQEQSKSQAKGQMWNQLGQLGGYMMNKGSAGRKAQAPTSIYGEGTRIDNDQGNTYLYG